MKLSTSLRMVAATFAVALAASPAMAAFPERPIQIIVPFAAGSPPDLVARVLVEGWKRSGFADASVVNQPGAGGSLAVAQVARSPADGYTLALAGDAALVVNPALYPDLPLSPLKDLTPVSQLVVTPTVLVVGKENPARNLKELLEAARQQPGGLSFASAGGGTSSRRNGELLQRAAGVKLIHVPYKGSPLPDVAEGRVTMFFASPATIVPFLSSERLRMLGVVAPERLAKWPDVPTLAEAGWPQVDALAWFGLVGPAGMSPDIAARLRDEAAKALQDPSASARLDPLGARVVVSTPASFRALLEVEVPKGRAFVRELGLQAE